MESVIISKFGNADVLELVDQPIPSPNDKQALIKLHAAGLNPIDYKIREGSSFVTKKLTLPVSLGYELSGEIIALGKNVSSFQVGDEVLGIAGLFDHPGCYAEYVCTTPENLIRKPKNLPFIEAASLNIAGLTALQALRLVQVNNKRILVQAGAGGVGHIVVQLAKLFGAYVIATASSKNHEFLYELGVDECIDYQTEDFVVSIENKVDVVMDLIGGEVGIRSLEVLSPSGCLITVPSVTADKIIEAAKQKQRHALTLVMKPNMQQLAYLAELIVDGQLKIEIDRVFELSQVKQAHELLESGHVRGKLVFRIS